MSYPKVKIITHKDLKTLFDGFIVIQEKVDGSQFSASVDTDGNLTYWSHHQKMPDAKMFDKAIESITERKHLLRPGLTYYFEYLRVPKHNQIAYDRVPLGHLMLFDIFPLSRTKGSYEDYARAIKVDCAPILLSGNNVTPKDCFNLLDRESFLGGAKIEGVVIKRYNPDFMVGKLVNEAFKEVKKGQVNKGDIFIKIAEAVSNEARWLKAIQHLKEQGMINNAPEDIPKICCRITQDIEAECLDEIKEMLFAWGYPKLKRKFLLQFPAWYKSLLLKRIRG